MRRRLGLAAGTLAVVAAAVGGGLGLQAGLRNVSAREPAGQARELRRLQADLAARERRALAASSRPSTREPQPPRVRRPAAQRADPGIDALWRAYPL